jgi:hypothetical protein
MELIGTQLLSFEETHACILHLRSLNLWLGEGLE